jgi:hypothetical protein
VTPAAAKPKPLTFFETDFQESRGKALSAQTDPLRSKKPAMPAPERTDQDRQAERSMRDSITEVISKQVVQSLGFPAGLLKVQVRPVCADRYRVNVFVAKEANSVRITDSFFLIADDDGKILKSSPEIIKRY